MGKRKTKSVPVLTLGGVAFGTVIQPIFGGGFAENRLGAMHYGKNEGLMAAIKNGGRYALENYTGYDVLDGTWDPQRMLNGEGMVVAGAIGDKLAKAIGVNRMVNKVLRLFTKYRWG